MRESLLIIGLLLPLAATAAYTGSILKGKSLPQRMTRFLLVVITAVMTGSLWANGDTSGLWLALTSFLQSIFLWVLSFKYGLGGRDTLDMICLVLCLAGLGLWLIADEPWIGLLASIAADAIAMVPALRKTIRLPHTEMALFYAIDTMAGLAIMFAGPLTLEAIVFPVYIAVINFAFVAVIKWPRRQLLSEVPEPEA